MRRPTLAILATLAWAVAASAAAPPPAAPERPAPGPLVNADEVHVNPLHLSLAVFAAATPSGTAPWATLGSVYAGEQHHAWSLDGPMTNRYSRVALGASALALAGAGPHPGTAALVALGVLEAGQQLDCWSLIDTDQFRPLPEDWLRVVSDNEPIGAGGIEAEVYSRALTRANFTSPKAFRKAARRDVTYAHVYSEPARYRGVVVRVEGRLLRVNRFDPPHEAQEAGVHDVYEAWVFNEQLGTNPYCVLFTQWPAGLPRGLLGENRIDRVIRVAIDGYFFKRYRYKANDPRGRERDAPLVMGHTLLLLGPAEAGDSSATFPVKLLMGVFGAVFGGLIVGVLAVTYWYRRSDSRVRRRILARMPEFVLPPPEAPPVAAPVRSARALPVPRRTSLPAGYAEPTPGEPRSSGRREKPPPDEDAGA